MFLVVARPGTPSDATELRLEILIIEKPVSDNPKLELAKPCSPRLNFTVQFYRVAWYMAGIVLQHYERSSAQYYLRC